MSPSIRGTPFDERGGRLRGLIDLAAGRYPAFTVGGAIGSLLPVFHFHGVTPETFEPQLRYLVENGYATVASAEIEALVRDGRHPGPKRVVLAFDDALASLWVVAGPLLRRYGLRAVVYAISGRIAEASGVRPTIDEGADGGPSLDSGDEPCVTWPELRALASEGIIEVQSHTHSHALVFTGDRPLGFVGPAYKTQAVLRRPRLGSVRAPGYLEPTSLGHPMFARRSRMSDGRRFVPDAAASEALTTYVAGQGGARFFERPRWEADLAARWPAGAGRWESEEEQRREIEEELVASRDTLEARLGVPIRHACLPWGVSGAITRAALERVGYRTAFANRWKGRLAVAHGDDSYFLKRLSNRYLYSLPGQGRRAWQFMGL